MSSHKSLPLPGPFPVLDTVTQLLVSVLVVPGGDEEQVKAQSELLMERMLLWAGASGASSQAAMNLVHESMQRLEKRSETGAKIEHAVMVGLSLKLVREHFHRGAKIALLEDTQALWEPRGVEPKAMQMLALFMQQLGVEDARHGTESGAPVRQLPCETWSQKQIEASAPKLSKDGPAERGTAAKAAASEPEEEESDASADGDSNSGGVAEADDAFGALPEPMPYAFAVAVLMLGLLHREGQSAGAIEDGQTIMPHLSFLLEKVGMHEGSPRGTAAMRMADAVAWRVQNSDHSEGEALCTAVILFGLPPEVRMLVVFVLHKLVEDSTNAQVKAFLKWATPVLLAGVDKDTHSIDQIQPAPYLVPESVIAQAKEAAPQILQVSQQVSGRKSRSGSAAGVDDEADSEATAAAAAAQRAKSLDHQQAENEAIAIELQSRPVFNYAMQGAGIPLVHGVAITNKSQSPIEGLTVTLRVSCALSAEPIGLLARQIAEIGPGETVTMPQPELQLDSGILVQLDESAVGAIDLEVSQGSEPLVIHKPIRVLAYNQWSRLEGIWELLACHVLPNHPAIESIRAAGSQVLKQQTGSSSQEGYQSGGERAFLIAKATYEALQRHGIRYSNPPAGSEESQKVRTPDQVMGQKFGTCLDTTCLMAACLEQAGLHPVMFVVEGHALVGLWLDERLALPSSVSMDPTEVMGLIEAKALLPIETTTLCDDAKPAFEAAVAEGRKRLATIPFQCMIDLRRARLENLRPLPSRIVENGKVTVVHQEAAVATTVVMGARRVQGAVDHGPAPKRFQSWQRDLLDLSLHNPLLNIKIGRGGGVRLVMPPDSIAQVERALASEQGLLLVAHDELTELQRTRGAHTAKELRSDMLRSAFLEHKALFVEEEQEKLRTRLRQLMNKARVMQEESGTNILHMSLGTVVWTDPEKGKKVHSPLLVMPVRVTVQGRGKPPLLEMDPSGGGTVVNQCLLQKLAQTFRLEVPEIASWRSDREDADISKVLQDMRAAIAREKIPGTVVEDAALCLLHFGKFRMWKDLQEHWPQFMGQPVVRHFVEKAGQTYEDPVPSPSRTDLETEEVYCPIPIDGSQLEAVIAASRGCSFVLEGPPGTGKSQTITNLIANALAHGKKILFVAEKRAALEVVKTRLNKVGLSTYCLDIHGKASKLQELRTQLMRSLEVQFAADLGAFETQRRELADRSAYLRRYAEQVHERNALGYSLWSARQAALGFGDGPVVEIPATWMAAGQSALDGVRTGLKEVQASASAAGLRRRHPWGFVDTGCPGPETFAGLQAAVVAVQQAATTPCPLLDPISQPTALRAIAAMVRARAGGATIGLDALRSSSDKAQIQSLASQSADIERSLAAANGTFADSILAQDVAALANALDGALKSFFLFRGGKVRKAVAAIQPHLRREVQDPKDLVSALRQLERIAADGFTLAAAVKRLPGVQLPQDWGPHRSGGTALLRDVMTALHHGAALMGSASEAQLTAAARADLANGVAETVRARAESWDALWRATGAKDIEVVRWLDGRTLAEAAQQSLALWTRDADKARFLDLDRWLKLQQRLAALTAAGLEPLRQMILEEKIRPAEAITVLERSLAHACLDERLRTLGFERFDGKEHNDRIRNFAELSDKDSAELAAVLPVKLLNTRPFRPGQRIGRVGELVRNELSRTKGGRSIRQLMEDYAEAIITLTPCVLASPDSVAQFLVPGVIEFDLVVFDEASQVPVADAIGAIGRGKSICVVGDSRQMPPTAFFSRTSSGDDEEGAKQEDLAEDMESILSESVASGLKRVWLSWHYRSQDESLIAFSNRHYYESRLASFPGPTAKGSGKGLSWIKVDGAVFDSGETRTNKREAEAVVREVQRRLQDPVESKRSMGIVTMNLSQAELTRELLERAADSDPALQHALDDESDDRMFIKNLENVQGDERDVILISLTYARNQDGKQIMNFGPLGKVGGERRWNVLVTRARQQVVVISSMEPEDIRVERISALAKGVHHMRAYMEMCKRGVERSPDIQVRPVESKDHHRDAIASALRKRGLVVEANVGLSTFKVDLALAHGKAPDQRLVAVLLDGPGYSDRRTVQDRDALPAAVLQRMMGWQRVVRIWLPEWLLEEARIVDEVVAAVEELHQAAQQSDLARDLGSGKSANANVDVNLGANAIASMLSKTKSSAASMFGEAANSATDTASAPKTEVAAHEQIAARRRAVVSDTAAASYRDAYNFAVAAQQQKQAAPMMRQSSSSPAVPAPTRDAEDLDYVPYTDESIVGTKDDVEPNASGLAHGRIRQVIAEVLRKEAPIESMRLAKLVARRFGLQRVREDRARVVLNLLAPGLLHESALGAFVWATREQRATWKAFRRTPEVLDEPRRFEHVAPEEVRNAIVYCAIKGMGLSDDGAAEEVAQVFGVRRVTQDLRARITAIVEWSIQTGALQRDTKGRLVVKEGA